MLFSRFPVQRVGRWGILEVSAFFKYFILLLLYFRPGGVAVVKRLKLLNSCQIRRDCASQCLTSENVLPLFSSVTRVSSRVLCDVLKRSVDVIRSLTKMAAKFGKIK